jgi:hypothetical protein
MIAEARHSLSGLSKTQRQNYQHIIDLSVVEKLQSALLLLTAPAYDHELISQFEEKFGDLFLLNAIRNAIVHHEFGPPTHALASTCAKVRETLRLSSYNASRPWEELLNVPAVASWACKSVSVVILTLESVERNRTIHLSTTEQAVASAISPLTL